MRVTMIGTHLCKDTLYALYYFMEHHIDYEYKDLSTNLEYLKEFLKLREGNILFDEVRKQGKAGVPCFILEDNTMTLDLNEVLQKI